VKANVIAMRLRNNSTQCDIYVDMPLEALLPGMALAALYSMARLYVLVEDIISLRALPPSAYDTVDWPSFFLHII